MAFKDKQEKAEYDKAYYAVHGDSVNARRRERYKTTRVSKVASSMVNGARTRSKAKGLPCTISVQDFAIPSHCPVLGIPLQRSEGKLSDGSPSLDQIEPGMGYIPGNVRVISHRANRLKCDATVAELELIIADLRKLKEL